MQKSKSVRLHRNLCLATQEGLTEIFLNGKYADKVVEATLKSNKKWGARDRHFIAESTYEVVRWKRLLLFLIDKQKIECQEDIKNILTCWFFQKYGKLPEWNIFSGVNFEQIQQRAQLQIPRAIKESIPDWLDELGIEQLGENWTKELQALNRPASVVLRANTLKISREELQKLFTSQNIEIEPIHDVSTALVLKKRKNLRTNEAFKKGFFEIQDASSQQVAEFLEIFENQKVIDACAGAGGKTLHLATLLKNTGNLIAFDPERYKLKQLQKRAQRAGVTNLQIYRLKSLQLLHSHKNTADRLLLDVPCSGLGVLRRNPDAKWKLTPRFIKKVQEKQQFILQNYASLLRVGGKLVYATCSILPTENQGQIEAFLQKNSGFELEEERTILPAESGFDGFYMARLRKKSA